LYLSHGNISKKYFPKIFSKTYFPKNIFQKIFSKKYFPKNIFQKSIFQNILMRWQTLIVEGLFHPNPIRPLFDKAKQESSILMFSAPATGQEKSGTVL
jgi:hypothetical protein